MNDFDLFQEKLKKKLSKKRYRHTVSAAYLAASIAMSYGEEDKKVFLAGLLHDCAKYQSDEELLSNCRKIGIEITGVERKNPSLLHAKMGTYLAAQEYGVYDNDVLNAILYHISGRPDMTFIEKAVYTADYLEFWRSHLRPGKLQELRKLVFHDINQTVYRISELMIPYLEDSGNEIDELVYEVRDFYKDPQKWRDK